MAEKQISIDDMTMPLPDFFTVIATQNPTEHHGTYPLPESQLDRFMIRIDLGYMSANLEKELLVSAQKPLQRIEATQSPLDRDTLSALRTATIGVHLDETIADYLLRLVVDTRTHPDLALGCSTRGAMDFAMMARAHAFVSGRDYVLIDDVKLVAPLVLSHRLVLAQPRMDASDRVRCLEIVEALLRQIPVPR